MACSPGDGHEQFRAVVANGGRIATNGDRVFVVNGDRALEFKRYDPNAMY